MRGLALGAVCAVALAASVVGPCGALAQPAPSEAAARAAKGPGYVGIYGEPVGEVGQGLRVTAVDPGSPADQAKIVPGDTIKNVYINNMGTWRIRLVPVDNQEALDAFLATTPPGTRGLQVSGMLKNYKFGGMTVAAVPEGLKPPATVTAPSADAVEATRTTYLSMCGRGAEKLGAATCAALKRDLDGAVAQREEAARVAEVLANHRALCGPGATTGLSKATCDAMLAEAAPKAPAAAAPPAPVRPASTTAVKPAPARRPAS